MLTFNRALAYTTVATALFAFMVSPNPANAFDTFWNGGTGDWTTGSNWDTLAQPGDFGFTEDVGVINNGTATLSTTAFDSGALALGYVAESSGTLIIQNGGSLTLVETEGAAQDIAPNGAANIGFEGGSGAEGDTGLLEIQGGGTLNAVYFDINQNGTLRIGTGSGAATAATSSGSLFSNGTLEVIGPGHNVTIAANLNFEEKAEGNSRFVPRITGSSHTVIDVAGTAVLGGSIVPEFSGVTPAVGNYWDLIDATEVQGTLEVDASNAPAAAPGTAYTTRVVAGGKGEILQLGVRAFATLKVDTDTGAMSLVSESGDPINMVAYSILSPSGRINPANWNSLTDKGTTGWEEANGTATSLNELNAENGLAMSTTAIGLGTSLYAAPTEFGVAPDISFQYGIDGELLPVDGIVELTGSSAVNNLLLTIDPTTGEGQLKNSSPFDIDLLAYSIISGSGSLNEAGWDSLDGQGVAGWSDGQGTATANNEFSLAELVPEDPAASLTANQAYSLGDMFQNGGNRDLQLEFAMLVDGVPEIMQGVVQYGEIMDAVPVLFGDADNDGAVAGSDLLAVTNNFGSTGPADGLLLGDADDDGAVAGSDLLAVTNNFGSTLPGSLSSGSAAVPEPTSLATLFVGLLAACGYRARQTARCRA